MFQNMTENELAALWHMTNPKVTFDLTHGIVHTWASLVQKRPDLALKFGPPINDEMIVTVGSGDTAETIVYIDFAGGGRIAYFTKSQKSIIIGSPVTGTEKPEPPEPPELPEPIKVPVSPSAPTVAMPAVGTNDGIVLPS